MKFSREVKTGIIFIASIGLFVWGFNFLKGKDVFKREHHYFSVYHSVGGLAASSPVYLNGLKVGIVKDVHFHPDGPAQVVVDFATITDLKIPSNSVVWIVSADLMGTKAIDLRFGDTNVFADPGDTLKGMVQASLSEEVNRQVLPLKTKAESLMGSIDSAMTIIRYVFNEETRKNLEISFSSIKSTIENLEHTTFNIDTLVTTQRGRMASIISSVEAISGNIKNNNQKISNIISQFSSIADTLARVRVSQTILNIDKTLSKTYSLIDKVNSGEGSLGLLLNNDSLYNELSASASELKLLLEDMRLNPKRYVQFSLFGSSGRKQAYQPPGKK